MTRCHVGIIGDGLPPGTRFCRAIFRSPQGAGKRTYLQWLRDGLRTISTIRWCGQPAGVNHLGTQIDSTGEFVAMRSLKARTSLARFRQGEPTAMTRFVTGTARRPPGVGQRVFHTIGDIKPCAASSAAESAETHLRNWPTRVGH